MNLKADLIYKDCEYAIARHTPNLQGIDFRLSWWTIVSLLRAIGHVLDKVDTNTSPKHRIIISAEYNKLKSSKPKPEIYWEFTDSERNRFIKEYEYNVRRQLTNSWINEKGEQASVSVFTDDQTGGYLRPGLEGMVHESFIKEGFFKGANDLHVAAIAIAWWRTYLDNIKARVESD